MASQTRQSAAKTTSSPLWRARALFEVGTTRRQRQQQYRQQINAIWSILAVAVLTSAFFVIVNWRNVGAVKELSCTAFSQFCVPLAGESPVFDQLEAEGTREMDFDSVESPAADGVVRYVGTLNEPRLGDPSAPIDFIAVSDYACPHCQDFHQDDLAKFIDDYVLTGKATFGFALATWTGQTYSEVASQAALCAGEQGAFWEFSEELFYRAEARSIYDAFTMSSLRTMARDMGLDDGTLERCVSSARYEQVLADHRNFALDHGVTGTPTLLVRYPGSDEWTIVNRSYQNLAQLTDAANQD